MSGNKAGGLPFVLIDYIWSFFIFTAAPKVKISAPLSELNPKKERNKKMRIEAKHKRTGEVQTPYRYSDGKYRVARPDLPHEVRKKAENQIRVGTLEEVAEYIRQKYHVRMKSDVCKAPSLRRPQEIIIYED